MNEMLVRVAELGISYAYNTGRTSDEAFRQLRDITAARREQLVTEIVTRMVKGSINEVVELVNEILSGHKVQYM